MKRHRGKLLSALIFGVACSKLSVAQSASAPLVVSNADNAWMLVNAAIALMMTGPGPALFYGGLVRKKNVLSVMMQSFAMMAIITVLWAVVGYSLAFDAGNSFVGGFHHVFLRDVGLAPDADYGSTEPMPPHSVVLSFIGACLLWVGWFGFNAGSALAAGTLATSAFVNTHFAAAAAGLAWAA